MRRIRFVEALTASTRFAHVTMMKTLEVLPDGLPRRAACRFAGALRERYRDALVSVRLFGSCARGEMREDSDVDVAVVLERVDWRTKRDVIDLSAEIGIEHDVLLSPTVLDRATFEHWRAQERLFVMDIEREGLPL